MLYSTKKRSFEEKWELKKLQVDETTTVRNNSK